MLPNLIAVIYSNVLFIAVTIEFFNLTTKTHRAYTNLELSKIRLSAPVLWRILMAQAFIYRTVLINYEKHYENEKVNLKEMMLLISSNWRSKFDWRQESEGGKIPDKSILKDPFDAVESLLRCLNGNIWGCKSNKPIYYFSNQKSRCYTNSC